MLCCSILCNWSHNAWRFRVISHTAIDAAWRMRKIGYGADYVRRLRSADLLFYYIPFLIE